MSATEVAEAVLGKANYRPHHFEFLTQKYWVGQSLSSGIYGRFRRLYLCFMLLRASLILDISSETSVDFQGTALRHIPEDKTLTSARSHGAANLTNDRNY
jgi:hypothetical protein